jgi:hypothetical protein
VLTARLPQQMAGKNDVPSANWKEVVATESAVDLGPLGKETLQVSTTDHFRKTPLEVGQPVTVQFHATGIHALP